MENKYNCEWCAKVKSKTGLCQTHFRESFIERQINKYFKDQSPAQLLKHIAGAIEFINFKDNQKNKKEFTDKSKEVKLHTDVSFEDEIDWGK